MKLTFDHNVVIDFVVGSPRVNPLHEALKVPPYRAHTVKIGASEMRPRGIQPDRDDRFGQLLSQARVVELLQLAPMLFCDVTFLNNAFRWDETMSN